MRTTRRPLVVLTVVALSASAGECLAQIVPYKTSGTGIYSPVTGDYSGSGVGTHMGLHTFLGNVAISPTANPFVFDFHGTAPQKTIAADGDHLFFDFSGQVVLIPLDPTFTTFSAIWTANFVVVSGTGRFAHAGPAADPVLAIAINDPFTFTDPAWSFSWELTGKIRLH
jgi:hypothetical protein